MNGGVSMIVNKALMAAAVLLFAAPVVPAVAHDDYGDHVEHLRLHRDVSEARYVRCLECPGNWDESWIRKSAQDDKWSFCVKAAMMAANRRNDEQTTAPEPHAGIQGQGGARRHPRAPKADTHGGRL